ncbi:MAG: FKBP-type peptidyl-prolyl cis-trans isomerase [Coriobacteriales bacterium]|jgi:FKBP-type peptidyl-prolyl cis-trans isomerase 2|nr:FKBP-type peptidyl-prolyl cis-trans isomerase [Coriobacteriales bacterium]
MRKAERSGKCALVRYKGGAAGEEPVEDHTGAEPERIFIGTGAVPPGIDDALYDMEIGEQRTVLIPPQKAYGFHDPQGVRVYPRSMIPAGDELEVGSIVSWVNPLNNVTLPVRVIEATDDYIKLDFNHPLAGKTLEYWLELIDIVDMTYSGGQQKQSGRQE